MATRAATVIWLSRSPDGQLRVDHLLPRDDPWRLRLALVCLGVSVLLGVVILMM
jgi:hypothetical protein